MKVRFSLCRMVVVVACLAFAISCDDDDENTDVTEIGSVTLDVVAQDLAAPLVVIESPDNSGRLFIADQGGQIYIVKDGSRLSSPFLDISSKVTPRASEQDERGLLGLAFHPDFASNGRFFV